MRCSECVYGVRTGANLFCAEYDFLVECEDANGCESYEPITGGNGMRLTYWSDRKGSFDWLCDNNEIADKLAAYEDAEEQGRLVILPCKVGDIVYRIHTKDHIVKNRIIAFHVSASGIWYWDETGRETPVETIGKTVFLTRAEAEAAMKGETGDA